MKRTLLLGIALCSLAVAAGNRGAQSADLPPGMAGQYLASHFAQSVYDWKEATDRLGMVLQHDPGNPDLLKRAMVLAMASGDMASADGRAAELLKIEEKNNLALMVRAIHSLSIDNAPGTIEALDAMPPGDITDFIKPLLKGWALAGSKKFDASGFNATAVHAYTGGLIASYLGEKKQLAGFVEKMMKLEGLTPFDAERVADLQVAADQTKSALEIYRSLRGKEGENRALEKKMAALEQGKNAEDVKKLIPALQIASPAEGAAITMYDMARIMAMEENDASSQLFAQMAIALDPKMADARILLANTLARNGRYDESIAYLSTIGPDHDLYLEIQHAIADLLEDAGRKDEALKHLEKLFTERNDVESLIRIGDIHRRDENYKGALKAYNRAASAIGDKIPEAYWNLLYSRGMVYEREGQWPQAESDLKAALVYRPDHPYILNYLGYSWADKGLHLDESLKLIERAVSLRPDDGYITDSLGWVLFMMGRYQESVPHLEQAVELLPYDSKINEHLGDAYWKVGRRLEARFQWERALNNADADTDKDALSRRLAEGLYQGAVKEAMHKSP